MPSERPWSLRRDTQRWRAGAVGVSTSAAVWLLAEAGYRYAGMATGLALLLATGWLLFDGIYSIYCLFFVEPEPSTPSSRPIVRTALTSERQDSKEVEYRRVALDLVWLVSIAAVFWIGGGIALQGRL